MPTYYDLFNLRPTASAVEVEMAFQRFVVRHRPGMDVELIFADQRFRHALNAYLTLRGPLRPRYDDALKQCGAYTTQRRRPKAKPNDIPWGQLPEFDPLSDLSLLERRMLMAHAALWRRQVASAVHLLRTMLERRPDYAPGWALLGEAYFAVDHLDDGLRAYQRAVQAEPTNAGYASRLLQALNAQSGLGELTVEASPEEQMLQEEMRARRWVMLGIAAVALALLACSFNPAYHAISDSSLSIPWYAIALQTLGVAILLLALAYGRVLQPFERVMVWSTLPAFSRGEQQNYPYGLLLIATGMASLWLSVLALLVLGVMDEEWPVSPSIMLGCCALFNALLTWQMAATTGAWAGQLIFGGNLLVLAAILGWWLGSGRYA